VPRTLAGERARASVRKVVGVPEEDRLGVQCRAGEVADVEREEQVSASVDGGSKDVDVVRVRQPKARHGRRACRDLRLRPAGAKERDLSATNDLVPCSAPRRGARPFLEDSLGPEGRELAFVREAEDDLAEDRRIEDAGVDQDAHQSSRKASALR
jgi:hypothetical protein